MNHGKIVSTNKLLNQFISLMKNYIRYKCFLTDFIVILFILDKNNVADTYGNYIRYTLSNFRPISLQYAITMHHIKR